MNLWVELDVNAPPEGDDLRIYCFKCGAKNRHEAGWRYCDDPERRRAEDLELAKMGYSREDIMMMMMMLLDKSLQASRLPKLAYECGQCRDDAVSSRTRSEANNN